MQNFPVPNKSLSGFQNFPSPSKLRWGFPDFRSSVIQKRGEISDWLGTWQYRIPLTIDSTKIDSDLTHFPVPIVLTGTDAEAVIAEVGSDNKKIAVGLSDRSQLYCEIEQWDTTNNKITLWVSRSDWVISSTADTALYLYYDGAQDDNLDYVGTSGNRTEVWKSIFDRVYTMSQDPSGGVGSIIDSTGNGNHGTPSGLSSGDLIDGPIGKALHFDGVNAFINIGPGPSATNFALQAQFKHLNSGYDGLVAGYYGVSSYQHYGLRIDGHEVKFYYDDGSAWGQIAYSSSAASDGSWHLASGSLTASTLARAYLDAAYSEDVDSIPSSINPSGDLYIGRDGQAESSDRFYGPISHVRVALSELSDAWIKADYHAQTNTLLTAGTPQEFSG